MESIWQGTYEVFAFLVSSAFINTELWLYWEEMKRRQSHPCSSLRMTTAFNRPGSLVYKQQSATTNIQIKPALLFWGENISWAVPLMLQDDY